MPQWADAYVKKLQAGETVEFRPRGSSMSGRVENQSLCTVEPITADSVVEVDDVVLCKVKGTQYLHLVLAVDTKGRYQIGNNRGGVNGWVPITKIYGRLVSTVP